MSAPEVERSPLFALIDRIVPDSLGLSPTPLLTARVLTGAVLLAVLVSILTGTTFWLSGLEASGLLTLGYAALVSSTLFVLRRTADVRLAMNVALVVTAIYFTVNCLAQNPIDVTQVFWVAILPLAAMLGLGRRAGITWAVIAVLEAAALVALFAGGWSYGERPDHPRGPALARLFTFVPAVAVLSYVFDKARARAFEAVERARAEAEAARRDAERASEAKTQFLANVSHELRTPMNAVIGLTGSLLREPLTPGQVEQLEVVQESGRAMVALVSDLLDIAKIEAGQLTLESMPVDLPRLLYGTAALFRASAEAKGLTLEATVEPGVPTWVQGDSLRLGQVLGNLTGNAVKFTSGGAKDRRGRVELRATKRADGRVELVVSDTGIGIAPEALPGLFQKFVQADASHTRRFGGTGLGLAIARELVELMGGEITVASKVGQGTAMHVVLPLVEVAAPPEPAPQPASLEVKGDGRPVLVVDDNLVNLRVAELLLKRLGLPAELVESGREAVERWAPGRYFAVLMDVQMPELDGYTACRLIREKEAGGGPHTPIIGLTASAVAGQREKGLAAGMDDYLTKPVTLEALTRALSSVAG